MDYYNLIEEKKIELLIELLNEERQERSDLAKKIHFQCGNVAALMRFIEIADRKFEQNKLDPSDLTQIKNIASDLHVELRELQYSVYPTGSNYNGLVSSLQKFISTCRTRFNSEIEFTCVFNKKLLIEQLTEISIYKTCTELIEFVCLQKPKRIFVRLELIDDFLQVDICRLDEKKTDKLDDLLEKIASRLYAKLIWQRAIVLPKTNWKDCFALSFLCASAEE